MPTRLRCKEGVAVAEEAAETKHLRTQRHNTVPLGRQKGTLDETFVDAICDPPELFT
jgi:hypothetical protein